MIHQQNWCCCFICQKVLFVAFRRVQSLNIYMIFDKFQPLVDSYVRVNGVHIEMPECTIFIQWNFFALRVFTHENEWVCFVILVNFGREDRQGEREREMQGLSQKSTQLKAKHCIHTHTRIEYIWGDRDRSAECLHCIYFGACTPFTYYEKNITYMVVLLSSFLMQLCANPLKFLPRVYSLPHYGR